MPTPWLIFTPQSGPKSRLFCFSYAGGNARCYSRWQDLVGHDVEVCAVQLPGRGTRRHEAPFTSIADLVPALASNLATQDEIPFAFFGHSLGALIAFELARYLQARQLPSPASLIVSGANAPSMRISPRWLHKMRDDELIAELKRLNGTPSAVMRYRELLMMALPVIRADFSVSENYSYQSGPLLAMPITVLAGRDDDLISAQRIEGWTKETSAACKVHWFEGDHFFINKHLARMFDVIRAAVEVNAYD